MVLWFNDYIFLMKYETSKGHFRQGYNARKVISEVYASFVLGGNVNTRRMSQPDGSIFHIKKSMKYSDQRKL